MEKLSAIEKIIWLIRILSGDSLGESREIKLRFIIDLGKNTKTISHPKPLRNDDPGMRNIAQNSRAKAVPIRKTKEITAAENGTFFVYFYPKNPYSFVILHSSTTLWKAP